MQGALFNSIITSMALSAVLTGCADPPRRVITSSGSEVELPACKEYVSKFSDVSIRADILNKYKGELGVSAGNRVTLDTLQQDYVIQAGRLCENAPLYFNSGDHQQYYCRDERLSNSLTQMRTINSVLEGIHNVGDAKSQAQSINNLVDDFMKRFFTQFDKTCSEPPKPFSLQEIRSELKDAFREVIAEFGFRQPSAPGPNLPQQEVTRELAEVQVRKELTGLYERVVKEYVEGDRYYKEEKFDTAISHFKNAIDLVPEIPSLYLALGKSYSASDRYNDAVATYDRGVKVAKQKEKVYVDLIAHRGSAKESLGYHQKAIDDLSLAITLSPDYADAYYNRGIAKYNLKDYPGAIVDYTESITASPDYADAHFNRGLSKGQLRDFSGAIADFTKSIELGPDHADAYYNRGVAKYDLKDFPGAVADFTDAIERNPNGALAYYGRGVAKILLNDLPGAIADYTATIKLNPGHADAYYNRGVAKGRLNDFPGAIGDYTVAINLGPSLEDAYEARGSAHTALGKKKEATDDFNRARALRLKSAQAFATH